MIERLIRRREVEAHTGLARSTIYEFVAEGKFPPPVHIGARAVAWRESDVAEWIESRTPHGRGSVPASTPK